MYRTQCHYMNRMMKLACNIDIVACRFPRPSNILSLAGLCDAMSGLVAASHGPLGASQIERRWRATPACRGGCTHVLATTGFCRRSARVGVTHLLISDVSQFSHVARVFMYLVVRREF